MKSAQPLRSADGRLPFHVAALALALLAGGCTSERVVLLPSSDGRPSAVVVNWNGVEQRLAEPYATAERRPFVLSAGRSSATEVDGRYGSSLAALPEKPVGFTVYFLEGTDTLTPESLASFERIKALLASRNVPDIQVVGHADRVGSVSDNDALSRKRAESVREALVAAGIAAELIAVSARGEREPAVPTADEVAEERNRRVEISVR